MCECYQIGGPFIAEDPDCLVHGVNRPRYRNDDFESWFTQSGLDESQREAARLSWQAAVESILERL